MTTLDYSNKLIEYFTQHTTLNLDKDLNKIFTISENPDEDKAGLIAALDEFSQVGIINKVDLKNETYYILKKPLENFPQTVVLEHPVPLMISSIINNWRESVESKIPACDIKNITSKDMESLLLICNVIMSQLNNQANP